MNIRAPWEIFENLNEIVYAVDMDTYDIIYLNKAAMTALQTTPEEYSREKCYRLFGKFSSPCHFCTNPKLREGEFVEWGYYNPHLKRAFKLKDTMYCHEGRRVRVEIAIDMMLNEIENKGLDDRVQDKIFINSCLELTHSASTPDESMNFLIQYLGQHKQCQGIDIYEVQKNNWLYHTYRWSAETGIDTVTVPFQIDFLQYIKEWKGKFRHNEPVLLDNIDILKSAMPEFYDYLAPVPARKMIFIPLLYKEEIAGFLRVDDPPEDMVQSVVEVSRMLSHFIVSIIQRRNLMDNLIELSFHDKLTGALNRNALNEYLKKKQETEQTRGVIYCDVVGLKKVNDLLGHASGDDLLVRAYKTLRNLFAEEQVYRIGGDEFIVIEDRKEKEEFEQDVERLKNNIDSENVSLSVGSAWAHENEMDFDHLLKVADERMYADKERYYNQAPPMTGVRRKEKRRSYERKEESRDRTETAFGTFIEKCYFDAETFFRSIALPDVPFYLYCGDLRKNLYYISDNLRDDFNFSDNLVYDFVTHLENRIYEPDRQAHIDDAKSMFRDKRTDHDICYRIYNKNKKLVLVRCRGIMIWSDDLKTPLFFSGAMVQLNTCRLP